MEKIKIKVEVFHEIDYDKPIPFSKIKNIIQDDDILHAGWDEGFYSENNSIDGHYFMNVIRERLENDAEFEKRRTRAADDKKAMKERRYESYLKLKKEFEPEADPHEDPKSEIESSHRFDGLEMPNYGLPPLRLSRDEDPKE
jgi:hypothetical protein